MQLNVEITKLKSSSGVLTKRISLGADGHLISDGSACVMGRGTAVRLHLTGMSAFADQIGNLQTNQAIALGALMPELPDEVNITTKDKLAGMNGSAPADLIARTGGHIAYRPNEAALALIDVDTKGMPTAVADHIKSVGGFWLALVAALPDLGQVTRVVRTSTSSGITRTDTGAAVKGSNGVHIFLLVQDGADIERFLRILHDRCWLAGFGWMMVGAGGQFLDRSLIDRTVYAPERLVFEAPPILETALHQDRNKRVPEVIEGEAADTRLICPNLTIVETARLTALKAAEKTRLSGDAARGRATFVKAQAEKIVARTGCSPAVAARTAERQCAGLLLPGVILPFDAEDMVDATVADVLANPDKFVGATLADPLEGPECGRGKAKIMRRPDGSLWINSFAHGRTVYELRHDAGSVEALVKAAVPAEAADTFVRVMLNADLASDEEQLLREQVSTLSGVKARPLGAKIKAAQAERAQQRAETDTARRTAERRDPRPAIPAPSPDAERLPVMAALEEVLSASPWPVPPMRDLDGHPVEVRNRPPMLLHELTSEGSNQNEVKDTRLPAPVLPLLSKHDRFSLAHEIERHIEFVVETEKTTRPVALPGTFVDHFMAYRDSQLPRVGAIVTAPLVLPNGTLLAPKGLDRERKLVFQIEPRLLELMPKPKDCTPGAAGKALDFLCNKWLCDVSTDFAGKCVLIAYALTILERVLLPERPAFFVTAGKRGGGKTTALMMLILAVTGKKPPAAAWSSSEEERRKAVLSYLAESLPAMVWDNIPLGTLIACPTLEKVLTAESYSDRVLGQSTTLTVPSFTVMSFTGNNIGPKGDMSSRSLVTRLEVDRIDPENRKFIHADPVAWTLANRGLILRALYVILLANPQLDPAHQKEAKTRFKTWWHLVGSALEHAAGCLVMHESTHPEEKRMAKQINFATLFADVEGEDEEGAALADVLEILDLKWPSIHFQAKDIVELINGDNDNAVMLRAFFAGDRKAGTSIPASAVGQRLSSIAGAPIRVGDRTLRLDRLDSEKAEKNKRAARFKVRGL